MAARIMASLVSVWRSSSLPRRRYAASHANVRSTTRRRGWARDPPAAVAVAVTARPHRRRTRPTNFRPNPPSAVTSRGRGSRRRAWLGSHRPPSRSWRPAAATRRAQTSPGESARMNRLRPTTFFPPVAPAATAGAGRLDRLAVDPPGRRVGRAPGLDPHVLAEPVVDPLPQPAPAPPGGAVEHGLVVGEVAGQRLPRRPAPQVVEDRVRDLPPVGGRPPALPGAGLGLGGQGLQPPPPGVGQVRRVPLACHDRRRQPKTGPGTRPVFRRPVAPLKPVNHVPRGASGCG